MVWSWISELTYKYLLDQGRDQILANEIISVEVLKELLVYHCDTGRLYWRERMPDMFDGDGDQSTEHTCACWNGKFAGVEALAGVGGHGYKQGRIFYRKYLAHRVAYALHYGHWPDSVDHINHNKIDNRIENLREVTQLENCRNMKISKLNTSGSCGVNWHKANKKWTACITINRKRKYLGSFDDMADAILARAEANKKWNFHENHGVANG